jgi:hypothetical protein
MAIASSQIALNTSTATLLATGAAAGVKAAYVTVSDIAFLGPSTVTAANGTPVLPNQPPLRVPLADTETLYAIAAIRPLQTAVVASVLTTTT